MSPEEALQTLDQAVSQLTVNRNTHATLQQAVMIIREALNAKEAKVKEKKA